ncbi:MAG: hypothetical protein ABIR77_06815 [Sphingomicrobium sp.]
MRNRLLAAVAVAALALPALAQDRPTSILPPGFGDPTPAPTTPSITPRAQPAPNGTAPSPATGGASPDSPAATASPSESAATGGNGRGEDQVSESDSLSAADLAAAAEPVKPVELPNDARRDPNLVGRLDPATIGLGADPFGAASGRFLQRAMRRTEGALPSRWLHIALRNALLARAPTPYGVESGDWVAERAWLLLRMGEADAARMLVAGVDVDDFTPKLTQVAAQSALASADPAALCPLRGDLDRVEPRIAPLVGAICSSLSGNPETAAADIDQSRRRGRLGGIDVSLADKLVGAGADTARAVTIEWEPVGKLNAWQFGLASATGLVPPDRLINAASPAMRAWAARAPMFSPEQRLPSARIATGMGVMSGQSLVDLYAGIYDRTDPDELGTSDAWQLRLAFTGRDQDARLAAMRTLWNKDQDSLALEASRAMLGVAASLIEPSPALAADAPNIIASLLAAGLDAQAARWADAAAKMDDAAADRCWAMIALAAPQASGIDVSFERIDKFIDRDQTKEHRRGALLVAGLAGIGRIDAATALRLSSRYGFGLDQRSEWGDLIIGAARRGQGGTATILAGLAFQSTQWGGIPARFLLHSVAALNDTGQGFNARMIAAEALSRS